MPLKPPPLDSRTFKELMDEAKARLPRYTPEWVNFNESDPGMALVQLHAWMTETILYELNRVPELNYLKFLDLLGVVPEPAYPARTELEFTLKDPLQVTVNIPRLTKVAVDDPAAPSSLLFETDRTLTAIDAAIGAVILPQDIGLGGGLSRNLVTRFEKGETVWAHNFNPFPLADSSLPIESTAFYIGLHLRPGHEKKDEVSKFTEDRFPSGPLDLFVDAVRVFDQGAGLDAPVLQGPIGTLCADPGSSGTVLEHISWHVFTDTGEKGDLFDNDTSSEGWTRLSLSEDSTQGLSGSGHLVFEMPASVTALSPIKLSEDFWSSFGGVRPPQTKSELIEQLENGTLDIVKGLSKHWETMGATELEIDELAACDQSPSAVAQLIKAQPAIDLDPSQLTLADWIKVNDAFSVALPQNDDGYLPLYWLRGRLDAVPQKAALPSALRGFHLNTVPATQASTRFDDQLGLSNGRPGQVFKLPKVPVLIDPATGKADLELEMVESGQAPKWIRVDDFYTSGTEDPHYMLDPVKGEIRLGDGRRGRIPVAGSTVTAVRYRVGGGAQGNVTAGLISKLKGGLRNVKGVTNRRAAHDGADAETLEEVKARAPSDLRTRDRAVSAEDFADLAMRTPGVALHRVFALPRQAVDANNKLIEKSGAVTLLVLPKSDQLMPQPDEDQKRAICRWLEPRRLITTELHIIGPSYVRVSALQATLTVSRDQDLGAVTAAVTNALLTFLNPITGGEDGTGWPFEMDIYYADLYQQILAVPGVRRAARLVVKIDDILGDTVADVAKISKGCLPVLSRDVIALVASYE